MNAVTTISDVLTFWFNKPMSDHWFSSTPEIDQEITDKYKPVWQMAKAGELDFWQDSAEGCLALCIVLDQMPLNMFRNSKESFSTEQQAVRVTKFAIEAGLDSDISQDRVSFLYMPLMHSENIADQDLCVKSFAKTNLDGNLKFAKHHRGIIEEYGRFPHRNEILGRENTPAESDYLKSKQAFTG